MHKGLLSKLAQVIEQIPKDVLYDFCCSYAESHEELDGDATGGRMIPTATIVTRERIFIPVIPEMDDYFNIKGGQLKFSVRFDSVVQ